MIGVISVCEGVGRWQDRFLLCSPIWPRTHNLLPEPSGCWHYSPVPRVWFPQQQWHIPFHNRPQSLSVLFVPDLQFLSLCTVIDNIHFHRAIPASLFLFACWFAYDFECTCPLRPEVQAVVNHWPGCWEINSGHLKSCKYSKSLSHLSSPLTPQRTISRSPRSLALLWKPFAWGY